MTEARIPTPRQIARTPVVRQPSALTFLGGAMQLAGQAGQQFEDRRRATDEQVAEIDHRIAMDEQKRQDDALFIEKAAEWAAIEEQARLRASELRSEGSYRDHADRVRQELDTRFRAFDESLATNERVRQRFRLGIVESAARIDAQEQEWARQKGFKVQGEALQAVLDTRGNQLSRAPADKAGEEFALHIGEMDKLIDAGSYSDEDAAIMKRAVRSALAPKLNEALFAAGQPQVVQKMIDEGFFDALDVDVSTIRNQVVGEQKALDLAAERAKEEQLAQARQQRDAIKALIDAGATPTQQEVAAVNQALTAAGAPPDEMIEFGALSVQIGLNRQYSEAADPDGIAAGQAAARIRAKQAAGTATREEEIAAAHLEGVASARAKKAGEARKELAGQGPQGQLAVLADLDRLPPEQRATAAQAAGLSPNLTGLRGRTREFAVEGRVQRKARPNDFGTKEEVEASFRASTGGFASQLGGNYPGMMEVAWDIYAATLAARGRTGWDAATFAGSVSQAFGRTVRQTGEYQGGIGSFGKHRVILPTFLTNEEFERQVRSLTFSNARYRDGRAVAPADVFANYRPEYFNDDAEGRPLYRMVDGSGRLLMQADQRTPYTFIARPRTVTDQSGWTMPGSSRKGGR